MSKPNPYFPDAAEILSAAKRIAHYINHTPVLTCQSLNEIIGASLFFKCENFQKVGAFKSRGAVNAVFQLTPEELKHGVGTHSSGNHAQALARAAALRNTRAHIVMPENAPKVKVDAVRGYDGIIHFCEPNLKSREETLDALLREYGLTVIHPYNNLQVIAGQATACLELIEEIPDIDIIMCPVGGGGLLSGTALSARYFGQNISVIAAEPSGADDAFRSFKAGYIIPSEKPETIADGLLTSLGSLTFPIIKENVNDIVCASETYIIMAMKLIWERMKIVIEPSSALPLAAIMQGLVEVKNKRIGIILSGGNIDLNHLPWTK
jgi:threonine dehydratase